MSYAAPLAEMRFVLDAVVGLDRVLALPGFEDLSRDLVDAVLEEAARVAGEVLAPLNAVGDRQPPVLRDGAVTMPPGFREAFALWRDGGWNGVPFAPEIGGQGLPWAVAFATNEMWQAANMAFGLCPLLNQGAIEALAEHGSEALKAEWLPKLVAGTWTGTMNLTEPQAGTDLGAIRTMAVPRGDGAWSVTGSKIFITYGEHDLADNIIHLVLARTPEAPAGTRGLSLFLVPKILADGTRNDVACVGIEKKLGIHASPTCTMRFGDAGGAVGWLVGSLHGGIATMFTMMNNARLSVGLQGVAAGDRAFQRARAYAEVRLQGKGLVAGSGTIIDHPDVRRMLLTMRAQTEAARAIAYSAAGAIDVARRHPDSARRAAAAARVDLLTPIVKAWGTDTGIDTASIGIQVHGGMGFIEETGAAQHWRDARIAAIYEGTNGVQAGDLAFRKVARDGGAAMAALIGDLQTIASAIADRPGDAALAIAEGLSGGINALADATRWIVATAPSAADSVAAAAAPYLELAGLVTGGAMLARGAAVAIDRAPEAENSGFLAGKIATARFFADMLLPKAKALAASLPSAHATVLGPV
jgi:alkylation response protein AidB-like acyl-CoA dehydrogenase